MPKRKRTREVTVKDVRTILRLSCAEGLSVREIADRLRIGKSSVSTYLYRAREAELAIWPLPEAYADDDVLKAALFGRKGRPRRDPVEPDWAYVSTELKRKGVALILLWQEYRESHPDGYAYTWFCTSFRVSTAAGICTGAAAQKCTTGSVVACPHSPWEGPARGATRPPRGWRRPARERGVWAHAGKRGVIRTVAGVVTGSA